MSTTTDAIGRVLAGRYRLETVIGTGASAHVFAALDVALQRRVAIKVLHPALAAEANFLRRFRAEAQAAAALNHPDIVAVYDWGEDEGSPFLVLQFLAGGSLRDMLDGGRRLTVPQAVTVGRQAAAALAYAHGRGVVHRDVKPANLLFDAEGRLAVADFGLARALSEAAWTEPVGATLGTARYAAPEQASGKPVDGRADVYALSLVLYETVTGVVPFVGDSTVATLMARVGASLPGHDALGPLSETLRLAAAADPDDRLDAAALAARLGELAEQLPVPQRLPLAGTGITRPPVDDRTELGHALFADAPTPDRRRQAPADPMALAAAVGVTEAEEGRGRRVRQAARSAAANGEPGTPRRRRWPWVLAVLAVVLALVAAGAVVAVRDKLFTPSHRLPALTGDTVAVASARLAVYHDTLKVVRHRSSLTVPDGHVLRQLLGAGTPVKDGSVVDVVLSSGPPPEQVPNLSGINGCGAVQAALQAHHLRGSCTPQTSTTVPAGQVISWRPQSTAPEHSTVAVVLSSGPPMVTIPDLTGISTCSGVRSAFTAAGLVASCTHEYSSSVPAGGVVTENPSGQAPQGSTVTVVLSEGPPPVTVPKVVGDSLQKAIGVLQSAGLVVGSIFGPGGGRVFATNPQAGQTVSQGTVVDVYTV